MVYHNLRKASAMATMKDVAVLSGSFNPLHHGHRKLKDVAEARLGQKVVFELSIANVEKATLSSGEVKLRLQQFTEGNIAVTHAPRFRDKAKLFPGCCFVVGFDTATRILDPRFYGNSVSELSASLYDFAEAGNSFLVAGRVDNTGRFRGVSNLAVPRQFRTLFVGIPETAFREDISSTELRDSD